MISPSTEPKVPNVPLVRLIQDSGVELTRDGNAWIGACPFHQDEGQALLVDPETQHWQCDGVCNTGGSAVEWVMKTQHVSRTHATELLRSDQPLSATPTGDPIQRTTVRQLDAPFDAGDDDQTILHRVIHYYGETLKSSPEALEYLHNRKLHHPELLEHFRLGFSNRTLGYRLPAKNRKEGAALRGRLQRLGILRSTGHELFRGSVVIPVINDGSIHQVYGRKIADKLRPGTPLHCDLLNTSLGIFNPEAVRSSDELIVCQSYIDALTFWCAGYRNVTCSHGANLEVSHLVEAFRRHGTRRVLVAYAANSAGDTAAETFAADLNGMGLDTYRVELPRGLDVNALARESQSVEDALGRVIRKGLWMGKGEDPEVSRNESCEMVAAPEENLQPEVETVPSESTEALEAVTEVSEPPIQDSKPESPDNPALPATVSPDAAVEVETDVRDNEIVLSVGDRRYRIRGLHRNLSYDQLKLNLLVSRDTALHVDTLDLYASRPRAAFIKQAAGELGVSESLLKRDLGKVLMKLELLQEENIQSVLTPRKKEPALSELEHNEAMAVLKAPDLVDRLLSDFQRCGVVGESTNKLVGYLAALSRKLDKPLAVMIQSSSAAGKSALMEAVLSFMPEEDRVQYSAMTGQSLFYMGGISLSHKVLAISEEEGASNASYALKILQSEGQLTIASTGKDPFTGKHTAHEYRVQGPVMIFSTTTAIDIDEELLNRCLVLTVDEDRNQTQAIHDHQRFGETLEGFEVSQTREDIVRVHRNAQRLLKPFHVVNPYALQLTFPSDKTRARRDHQKYLALIRTIALLHQYQREIKTTVVRGKSFSYIEATPDDIALANRLANEVLGRSLDELPPQTRRLLALIDAMVTEQCGESPKRRSKYRFCRREIREYTGWGNTQLKVHLKRLEALEYLLIHRGGCGRQRVYELLYRGEGEDGNPFLMGLIDVEALRGQNVTNRSGLESDKSGEGRATVGTSSAPGPTTPSLPSPSSTDALGATKRGSGVSVPTHTRGAPHATSHRTHSDRPGVQP